MQTQVIRHPVSGLPFAGFRIPPGTVLRESDVYDSTTGKWERCPCVGAKLQPNAGAIWMRQRTELSEEARALLAHLNRRSAGYDCIARRNNSPANSFCVIPSPAFNWDARVEVERVKYPKAVDELADNGYLALGEHTAAKAHADYSPCGMHETNLVYTLTEDGKAEGKRILGI